VALRPNDIFGPNDHTVSEIISKAKMGKFAFVIGNGENIVDITFVKNVCHG